MPIDFYYTRKNCLIFSRILSLLAVLRISLVPSSVLIVLVRGFRELVVELSTLPDFRPCFSLTSV